MYDPRTLGQDKIKVFGLNFLMAITKWVGKQRKRISVEWNHEWKKTDRRYYAVFSEVSSFVGNPVLEVIVESCVNKRRH